jgi:hypothetical protein
VHKRHVGVSNSDAPAPGQPERGHQASPQSAVRLAARLAPRLAARLGRAVQPAAQHEGRTTLRK